MSHEHIFSLGKGSLCRKKRKENEKMELVGRSPGEGGAFLIEDGPSFPEKQKIKNIHTGHESI
jgi:hypothetical protein